MDLGIGSFAGEAPGGNLCIGKEGGDGMRTAVAIVLVGAAGLPSIELREVFSWTFWPGTAAARLGGWEVVCRERMKCSWTNVFITRTLVNANGHGPDRTAWQAGRRW